MSGGLPCFYCNARPDIGCRHRPADPDFIPADQRTDVEKRDGRQRQPGHETQGLGGLFSSPGAGLEFKSRKGTKR